MKPFRPSPAALRALAALFCCALALFAPSAARPAPASAKAAWLEINYDDLIERGTLTHSGKTVGALLDGAGRHGGELRRENYSDLQPCLEPFSFVLNDVAAAAHAEDRAPYTSILADYPAGSRQPAWAALFREGRYQLFFGGGKARLFLQGDNPASLWDKHFGVTRHPLREALEKSGVATLSVEVYAFQNDYAARTLRLNLAPATKTVTLSTLAPRKKELPLADLASFFSQAVTPEGAEIDANGDFFLYGSPSPRKTVAGAPLALEDFAVVYRSIFHNGANPPYISLDPFEDNRFAKVNFGGLLEDTRVGSVVLEADKVFKTLCTGLDANTHLAVTEEIRKAVPDFVSEDERSIRIRDDQGNTSIRYWFYPDKLSSVTDGHMAAVENYHFLANAERQDVRTRLGKPQQEIIDHLNDNPDAYAKAFSPLEELQTVGRLMVLAKWLYTAQAAKGLDLDALLAVELSPQPTPRRAKKMLAVTLGAWTAAQDGKNPTVRVRPLPLDERLETMSPTETDRAYITLVNQQVQDLGDEGLIPREVRDAKEARAREQARLDAELKQLLLLRAELEGAGKDLNIHDSEAIARHNATIAQFNARNKALHEGIDAFNNPPADANFKVMRHNIVSIAGGISLRPSEFPKPREEPTSKLLQRFRDSRAIVRSSPGKKPVPSLRPAAPPHALPPRQAPENHPPPVARQASSATAANTPPLKREEHRSETVVRAGRKELTIKTTAYPAGVVLTGSFAPGGVLTLRKGQ